MAGKPAAHYEFELDLSRPLSSRDWKSAYISFIDDIREKLGARSVHSIPILPAEQDEPTQWLDVVLRTTQNHAVRLRTRVNNLYKTGYRPENHHQWFELSDAAGKPQNLIDGSTNLGFSGGHDHLLSSNGGNWSWKQVNVGLTPLREAVDNLSRTADRRERARSLLVASLMINEAIKFNDVRDFFAGLYSESSVFPSEYVNLVRGWGNISARLRNSHDSDDLARELNISENNLGIRTLLDATGTVGVIKDCHARLVKKRMLVNPKGYRGVPQGQPLVEVLSVSINNSTTTSGESSLYGTIKVTDGLFSQYIYDRSRDNSERIYAGDTILLTGPTRSISALDSFTIDVDLTDKNSVSSDKFSYGQVSWNVYLTAANEYDKPLLMDIGDKSGSVTVNYIVLSNAVQATVEVTLINTGDEKDFAEVYGLITARSSKFSNESMLFWKTKNDDDIKVSANQLLPLMRSAIAVSLDSSLVIRAELFDRDTRTNSSKEIANGTLTFAPYLSGTYTESISGKCGEIQVKVTWKDI
ncbi:uncharacterized protein LOC131151105 [Malania oleifera]|uniref:uncharacterized protein LOC131151105 n=1 Tax=Malania oleifera TaxID=397392 RepID=UPI0025AE9BF3|nr:uncharacterized protein LOC131151105 [Malania oleifera]